MKHANLTRKSLALPTALVLILLSLWGCAHGTGGGKPQGTCLLGLMHRSGDGTDGGKPQGTSLQGIGHRSGDGTDGGKPQGTSLQGLGHPRGDGTDGGKPQGTSLQGIGHRSGDGTGGGKPQGTNLQGLARPRAHAQETRNSQLEGENLSGRFVDDKRDRTMRVEITGFRGDVVDGRVFDGDASKSRKVALRPEALTKLRWQSKVCDVRKRCTPVRYRIKSAAPDSSQSAMPGHSSNRDVWLYEVEFSKQAEPGPADWKNICGSRKRGMFVNGRWFRDGSWRSSGYTFSCPAGVIAKCVRDWGYKPWKTLDSAKNGKVSLLPLHLACVRAARADYCGDGLSHTRNGTLIDIADRYGFNVHQGVAGFEDESAFGPDGAHWVRTPRWPTGRRTATGWRFATCERPNPEHATGNPLVYVQS